MNKYKCKCGGQDIYEGASGNVGQNSISLTPFQSQIPKEVPRPTSQEAHFPLQEVIQEHQLQQIPHQAIQETRSQKENIQKPKFNWSTDGKVNEELRTQVMKDIEITKQKDINIIQTKPGKIQNIKITPQIKPAKPPTPQPPTPPTPQPPTPPTSPPPEKSMTGWILLGVFGGIWCLAVIITMIVLLVKYR